VVFCLVLLKNNSWEILILIYLNESFLLIDKKHFVENLQKNIKRRNHIQNKMLFIIQHMFDKMHFAL